MKQRLGALLCLILGAVLISSGLSAGNSASAGQVNPCNEVGGVGVCPAGSLTINESTVTNGNPAAIRPSTWTLTLTANAPSSCSISQTNQSKTVDDGGSVTFSGLNIYTNFDTLTPCSYTLTETAVVPFTAAFDPSSPYSFNPQQPNAVRARTVINGTSQTITLTNTAPRVVPTSAPVTTTVAPSSTAASSTAASSSAASSSAAPISATASTSPSGTTVASSSSAAALASTGTSRPVSTSLVAGIALCLLGLVLLLAGRRPRGARHR